MVKCVDKNTRELCPMSAEKCDNDKCEVSPDISVVVPALNEIYGVPKLLESLKNQKTRFDFETVIADNGSDDGTYEYLQKRGDVRVVRVEKKGIAVARNAATRSAKAPYLLQTDADTNLPSNWVETMGRKLVDEKLDIVSGPVAFESENRLQKLIISSAYGALPPIVNAIQNFLPKGVRNNLYSGANFGFTRRSFNAVGGYDESKKWYEVPDFVTKSNKMGAKTAFVVGTPVKTSSRRFGNTALSAVTRMGHMALVNALRTLRIEQKGDYERVD